MTSKAPLITEMVRDGPMTLGAAQRLAAALPEDQKSRNISGCYKVRCASCPGCVAGCAVPLQCGGCVWTPASFYLLDLLIGMCFCNCADERNPGSFSCTDMKGNTYTLVKVDERGSLAWFSDNDACSKGDDLRAGLFCEKC